MSTCSIVKSLLVECGLAAVVGHTTAVPCATLFDKNVVKMVDIVGISCCETELLPDCIVEGLSFDKTLHTIDLL